MATERAVPKPRLAAQASVLKAWGQEWRRANGKGQQDLGRVAGYGSDASPKSAAVAISRIESGKTDPTGRYRRRLLDALGHTEAELEEETERALSRPGVFTRTMAGQIHFENEARRAQIIASSNLLTERVTFQIRNSERTLERARNAFVLPFLETAARVDWQPVLDAQEVAASGGAARSLQGEIRGLRGQTELSILKTVSESAADASDGAGTGAGTAAGVFVAVSAAGNVSTGTAIASLSGTAASSATLAWLGGGALAAGRMGVAGGTAVLTGVVALPALIAIGGVLIWKGRKLRMEAEAEAEKLDAAQQALEDMQDALPRAERWNEAQQGIIQRAELLGRTIHSRYADSAPFLEVPGHEANGRISWDTLSPDAQKALDVELKLLSIILDTQALPVWLGVTSVSQPDLTASQEKTASVSEEWIDESLTFAQFDLDEHEEWVRSLLARDRSTP
jgi:hypothetical protein